MRVSENGSSSEKKAGWVRHLFIYFDVDFLYTDAILSN